MGSVPDGPVVLDTLGCGLFTGVVGVLGAFELNGVVRQACSAFSSVTVASVHAISQCMIAHPLLLSQRSQL